MRYVKEFAVVLALLMLAGCAGKPVQESPVATDEGIPAGQITLYGEIHGIAAIKEYEAERWKECYDRGMRHLFVELSHYTAQWLNLWMDAEDDEILEQLHQDGVDRSGQPYGIGRVGTAPQAGCSAAEFATFIKEKLSACSIRFVETGRPVRRVAVGGGACASMLSDALAAGCDTFVTADVKYDQYLEAKALGINLMDAGHFATEDVVCPALVQFLSRHFPKVEVRRTESHREAYDSV